MLPSVGQSVLVRHVVDYDKQGNAFEKGGKEQVRQIAIVYHDGRIKDSAGDVWHVKQMHSGKAQWATVAVNPLHKD